MEEIEESEAFADEDGKEVMLPKEDESEEQYKVLKIQSQEQVNSSEFYEKFIRIFRMVYVQKKKLCYNFLQYSFF